MTGPPPPGWPGGSPPRRRRKRRVLVVTLVVVATLLLLVGVGGVLAAPTVRDVARDQTVRTTLPAEAGGLSKGDDATVLAELDGIDLASFDTPVKGYYEDDARPIVVWGGTGLMLLLDRQMDDFFKTVEDEGDPVSRRTAVSPGRVGGRLECAAMKTADGTNGLCVWMNHGALLAFLSPDRLPPTTAGNQVVRMLPDMVHRA
ncbi:MAG: hypothetical protein GEV07_00485 [Streptosporangiales bacterium]|nr:hypothetical protein [Streptosporangiales bacterium]